MLCGSQSQFLQKKLGLTKYLVKHVIKRISHDLRWYMIFIQRFVCFLSPSLVCFLSPSLGEPPLNQVGYIAKSYMLTLPIYTEVYHFLALSPAYIKKSTAFLQNRCLVLIDSYFGSHCGQKISSGLKLENKK